MYVCMNVCPYLRMYVYMYAYKGMNQDDTNLHKALFVFVCMYVCM